MVAVVDTDHGNHVENCYRTWIIDKIIAPWFIRQSELPFRNSKQNIAIAFNVLDSPATFYTKTVI